MRYSAFFLNGLIFFLLYRSVFSLKKKKLKIKALVNLAVLYDLNIMPLSTSSDVNKFIFTFLHVTALKYLKLFSDHTMNKRQYHLLCFRCVAALKIYRLSYLVVGFNNKWLCGVFLDSKPTRQFKHWPHSTLPNFATGPNTKSSSPETQVY